MAKTGETTLLIQGINCRIPEKPPRFDILYYTFRPEDQYFRRPEMPFSEQDFADANDGKLALTTEQVNFIQTENDRIDNGVWAKIGGEIVYLPGSYYFYVAYWTLEDGSEPEYREEDRLFFLFFEQCYLREPTIFGILRGKHRRLGATSQVCCIEVWIVTRNYNARGGIISKTGDDAKTAFTTMIVFGFKALAFFLQPRQAGSDDTKTKLVFAKEGTKKKNAAAITTKREGLNSSIDYKNTALNSYDSGRLTIILIDESGKWEEVNIYKYWQIVKKTLIQGVKKVGFAILPSTVNGPNKGGNNFKKLWDNSNQYKHGVKTPTGLVRYFIDAATCYAGLIDKFGKCDVAAAAVAIEESIAAQQEEEDRLEERRMLPRTEEDMFCFTSAQCEFNAERIEAQLRELTDRPVYLRSIRLYRDEVEQIQYADDKAGGWLLLEEPVNRNAFVKQYGNALQPNAVSEYIIGVDTFRSGFNSGGGSKGTVCVFKKSRIIDGEETGLYPVAFYVGRPRLVTHFADEVLKAAMWYGCKCNFEMDGGTFYYDHFAGLNALAFLEWTPKITKDSAISGKADWKPGAESANPFQLAKQLEVAKMYVDGVDTTKYNGSVHRVKFPGLLKQLLEYDHANRTKSDEVIALMMALLPVIGYAKKAEVKKVVKKVLPMYQVRMR